MDFPSGELEDDRRAGYQELAERIGEKNCMPCLPSVIQNQLLLFIPITCGV